MNNQKYIFELNNIKASKNFKEKTILLLKNPPEDVLPFNKKQKLRFVFVPVLALILVCTLLFNSTLFPDNTVQASENLMTNIKANKVNSESGISTEFVHSTQDFSVQLFQKSITKGKNSVVSPVSVAFALGVTANGANGKTLKEFENVLGKGINLSKLNQNYFSLASQLKSIKEGKIQIANSIWYRNKHLQIEKSFLQKNADYFGAEAYQLDFCKKATIDKINNWVKDNTAGKIDKMVEKIDEYNMLYLINTLYFESDWNQGYLKSGVENGKFYASGKTVSVPYMRSNERYICDEKADGMLKYFKDSRFAFVAVLPKEGVNLENYVAQMTGTGFQKLLSHDNYEPAECVIPKFKFEYETNLVAPLKAMGLDVFGDNANFNFMGSTTEGKLYVGNVLHKSFVEIDEAGTKAGAATSVEMVASSCAPLSIKKKIVFDRPFVFAIVDTENNLPIFIGTINNPAQ